MAVAAAIRLEKRNWLIHQLYIKQEFSECLELIETQLHATKGLSEYALYVKGLVKRQEGAIEESLQLFQAAAFLSPKSVANLKQVARSLYVILNDGRAQPSTPAPLALRMLHVRRYLLGKHKAAIGVYREISELPDGDEDWEIFHAQGMCHMYLQQLDAAHECLESANAIQRHDATFLAIANVYSLQDKLDDAIATLEEALEFSADSSDILTLLGLLYLRMDDNLKAFEYLGSSLTHDPRNAKTILAAGSIMQDHGEYDVALSKYRTAAASAPHSPHLWSNIGMCFFGKEKYVAAIACLKRAQYLDPFEWIIAYNIGLVHTHTGQYASAYASLSACVNLAPREPQVYALMAVVLARLGDVPSSRKAYARAVALEPQDATLRLNFSVSMANAGEKSEAASQLAEFKRLWAAMPPEDKEGLDEAKLLARSEAVAALLQGRSAQAAGAQSASTSTASGEAKPETNASEGKD